MSKGSSLRPTQVSREEFDSNWDKIFKKKEEASTKEEDKSKHQVSSTHTKDKQVVYIAHLPV